jgi:hypothetical protein
MLEKEKKGKVLSMMGLDRHRQLQLEAVLA